MRIEIELGDITAEEVDAIVNPANSYGFMGGGVAGAIKEKGGSEIELAAIEKAPIPLGHAILTTSGNLRCKHIIHSPTMEQPGALTTIDNVKEATLAALKVADDGDLKTIAIPGMGTGVGQIPKDKAAKAILEVIVNFEPKSIREILLCDQDKEMVKEFEKAWKN